MTSNSKRRRNVLNIETNLEVRVLNRLAKMLNDEEIVTSVQEELDPVYDETDEGEDSNNNESSKDLSMLTRFLR
ncbi:uncharacterized protein TNCV_4009601 [Trichonephila clavipes]|nr:uncharacterized protein TNCV_4009601 [Trichonephila clavipes]